MRSFFVGTSVPIFLLGDTMNQKTKNLVRGALIAALYIALTYLQNFLVPGSASMMIQFRVSEALCVLALYSPAAIWGLTAGCLVFNISNAAALPLDVVIGPAATLLACGAIYLTRKITIKGYPLLALFMPAIFNGLMVGWELSFHIGGGFWLNAMYVAIGEAAVLLILGSLLHFAIRARNLDRRLFS